MENVTTISDAATTAGTMVDIALSVESSENPKRSKAPVDPPKETPTEKQIKALLVAYGVDPKGLQPGAVRFENGVLELSDNDGPVVRGTMNGDKIGNLVWLKRPFAPVVNTNVSNKDRVIMQSRVVITVNPMIALSLASKGQPAVAVDKTALYDWVGGRPEDPTSSDFRRLEFADEFIKLIRGKDIVVTPDLERSEFFIHGIKYHVRIGDIAQLKHAEKEVPAHKLSGEDMLAAIGKASSIPRRCDLYIYDMHKGRKLYFRYPIYSPANDHFLPSIVRDEIRQDDEGVEYVHKKELQGTPLARSKATLIIVQGRGAILSLDTSDGANSVLEQMEGVTATGHTIEWIQSAEGYQPEALIERGFTGLYPNRVTDWRVFLACQKGKPSHKVRFATDRKGWYGTLRGGKQIFPAGYIHEGKVVRASGAEDVVPVGTSVRDTLQSGTLEGWCRITHPMLHNANLAALMGFAVSGIFLSFIPDAEPGIIHLVAKSGFGKTTTNRIIATLTTAPLQPGSPGSGIYTYRTTENGMEGPLAARNDCHFLLDEIGAANAHMDWTAFVYMMQGGKGKSRAKTDGSERESKMWRVQVISTGEVTFSSLLAGQKKSERGGLLFRFLDLHLADVPFYADIKTAIQSGDLGRYREIVETYAPGASSISGVLDAAMRGYEEHHGQMWMHLANALLDPDVRKWTVRRYQHWLEYFTAKVKEVDRIVHRRSKHLASSMTGLELLLRNFTPAVADAEAAEIIEGARQWLETYVWRAGLPKDFQDESELLVEKFLQHLRANPHRFLWQSTEKKDDPRSSLWGWETRLRELFVPATAFEQICVDIGEDKSRVKHALLKSLPDDEKWTYIQARPRHGSKASPVWGMESPTGFAASFRDFM
jgi:hypothetical protein